MRSYTDTEIANVQNYLMLKGHACPHVDLKNGSVHYMDSTGGHHRFVRSVTIDSVLEEIRTLKRVPLEHYTDKSIFTAGSMRYVVGIYQVMETNNKLFYTEDLSIELKSFFNTPQTKEEDIG